MIIKKNSASSIFGSRESLLKNDNNDIILSKRKNQEGEEDELNLLNKELEGKGDNKSSKEVNKVISSFSLVFLY